MKILTIILLAAGTAAAGCASTSGTPGTATTSATAPSHPHEHGGGDKDGMMAGMCPMRVPGTTVAATDVEGGIGLAFTTNGGDVADLRQRVRRMADMHNDKRGGGMMMGDGHGGMMKDGGMMMPAATASVEDIEAGARLVLRPNDPSQLTALQEHVRMKAQRMVGGECPMMALASGEHDAHHPGN